MCIWRNNNQLKNFMLNTGIILLAYIGLTHTHYATDTYQNISNENLNWQLCVGRYSIFILGNLFKFINISLIKYQGIFMFLSIVILGYACTLLNILLDRKNIKFDVKINFALLLGFINVYIVELFLFPEYCIYYSLGIFFAVLSVVYFIHNRSFIFSLILLIISLGFYQENIAVFIILSIFMICIGDDIKKKHLIHMFFLSGIASLFNILVNKAFVILGIATPISREASFNIKTIFMNVVLILKEQKKILWDNSGLLPQGVFLFIIIGAIVYLSYLHFYKSKQMIKFLCILGIIFGTYWISYIPHYISGGVWLSPRTIYPIYFWLSFIEVYILYIESIREKMNGMVTLCVTVFILMIQIWSVNGIILDHFSTNKVDQEYALNIYKEIQAYELKTGIQVTEISTVNDQIPTWKNNFIHYYSYNVNERAFINDWSDVSLINFVSGRSFKKREMDKKVYEKYFQGKNWEMYQPMEQLYFDKNVLYWCKY